MTAAPARIEPVELSDRATKRLKAAEQRNRARARNMGADYERVDFIGLCEEQGWRCGICGAPMDPELIPSMPLHMSWAVSVEHSPALASGGSHTHKGVIGAHLRCNLAKGREEDTARAAKTKRMSGEKGQPARRNKAKAAGTHRKIASPGFPKQHRPMQSRGFTKPEPQRTATRPIRGGGA